MLVTASVYLLFTLIRQNRVGRLKDIEENVMDTEDEEKKEKKCEVAQVGPTPESNSILRCILGQK